MKSTPGSVIILHKCTKIMIICYTFLDILRVTDVIVIFSLWAVFSPFTSLTPEKSKLKNKMKKTPGLALNSIWTFFVNFVTFKNCLGVFNFNSWKSLSTISWRIHRSSRPEVFLRKDVLKISRKFTGEHPCQSAISICCIFSEHLFWMTGGLLLHPR